MNSIRNGKYVGKHKRSYKTFLLMFFFLSLHGGDTCIIFTISLPFLRFIQPFSIGRIHSAISPKACSLPIAIWAMIVFHSMLFFHKYLMFFFSFVLCPYHILNLFCLFIIQECSVLKFKFRLISSQAYWGIFYYFPSVK